MPGCEASSVRNWFGGSLNLLHPRRLGLCQRIESGPRRELGNPRQYLLARDHQHLRRIFLNRDVVERLGRESTIEQRQIGAQAIAMLEVVGDRFGVANRLKRRGANELAADLVQSVLYFRI